MKRSVVILHKPGYYMHKVAVGIAGMFSDERAQGGGIVAFFIGAMIACIIALQVTWPVIDQAINVGTAMNNLSSAAQTLVGLVPLFLVLSLVMVFIRPLL